MTASKRYALGQLEPRLATMGRAVRRSVQLDKMAGEQRTWI